jgi:hypothetical protein
MQGPKSIRKHPSRLFLGGCVREALNACLVAEAERLHASQPSGFDPHARHVRVTRYIAQLWCADEGGEILCVWAWLSTGRKFRGSWLVAGPPERLVSVCDRVPWPFKGKTHADAVKGLIRHPGAPV